jgi:hyperosmotically inducible protein
MKYTNGFLLRATAALLLASGFLAAQDVQPDNTKMNKGDGNKTAVTADKQKMNANDRKLTQQLRKAVMEDKGLSTYAHNVKIVSENGMVTLRGPVRSEDEKKNIESKAIGITGDSGKVDDQLSVMANK